MLRLNSFACWGRLVLEKFLIGELSEADRGSLVQYQDDAGEGHFYAVLKRRVEKYFRGNEVCLHPGPCCLQVTLARQHHGLSHALLRELACLSLTTSLPQEHALSHA